MKLVKDIEKTPKDSEKISEKEIEEAFVKIIKWIGEDPSREGLLETPKRVIKSFNEHFAGYKENPSEMSGSITQVHENSPFLKEKHERLVKIDGKELKIKPDTKEKA